MSRYQRQLSQVYHGSCMRPLLRNDCVVRGHMYTLRSISAQEGRSSFIRRIDLSLLFTKVSLSSSCSLLYVLPCAESMKHSSDWYVQTIPAFSLFSSHLCEGVLYMGFWQCQILVFTRSVFTPKINFIRLRQNLSTLCRRSSNAFVLGNGIKGLLLVSNNLHSKNLEVNHSHAQVTAKASFSVCA